MAKNKYDAGEIGFAVFAIVSGIFVFLVALGFTIAGGQQLLWQLRRADCGSYTVTQQKEGNIPLQCTPTNTN